ncbi:MAG: DnaJ domain-containing protein [Wolinella succinogenes]|uniref:TerB family tellurite resistance protein n=1 Tax=Wolinella succinogenes TaxID=844 RepID=UPI001691F0C3|nr:TerB family tellurite resistance protein [Wolinella succinogenes]NLU33523.1 DnaJ domain-containing protein [Wolinella succinogenes]
MENFLLIAVMVILFFVYKSFREYFANPQSRGSLGGRMGEGSESLEPYEDPYRNGSVDDEYRKVEASEFGVIAALMAKMASADGKVCELEEQLVKNMLDDLSKEFRDTARAKEILSELFEREEQSPEGVELLALEFTRLTKGEYKKRLKLVEFLLTLAYADGALSEGEREIIIDIAAYLELDNEDFNRIYDEFELYFASRITKEKMDREEALKLFGLSEEEAKGETLKRRYRELVKEHHPDIIQGKGMDKNFIEAATKKLQEINEAYEILREHSSKVEA